jgi:plasmid maintenance system antidote protein VapI
MALDAETLDIKLQIISSGRHQYQIAREIDVSEIALSRFLHGRSHLSADKVAQLRAVLGMDEGMPQKIAG